MAETKKLPDKELENVTGGESGADSLIDGLCTYTYKIKLLKLTSGDGFVSGSTREIKSEKTYDTFKKCRNDLFNKMKFIETIGAESITDYSIETSDGITYGKEDI